MDPKKWKYVFFCLCYFSGEYIDRRGPFCGDTVIPVFSIL